MLVGFDYLKYAQSFIDQIKAKGIKLRYAKLFGSYAKNSASKDSDIDILLVANEFSGVGFLDNQIISDELIEFDIIQVKTYSINDYEEGDPLINEINETGISLNVN